MSTDRKIDVKELEAKIQRIKKGGENPTAKQYGDKLAELLNSKATARDNFVKMAFYYLQWLPGGSYQG